MLRTVRARLAVVAALVVTFVLVAVSLVLVWAVSRALVENLDQTLSDHADEIEAMARVGTLENPLTGLGDDDTKASVVVDGGTVIAASANAAGLLDDMTTTKTGAGDHYRTADLDSDGPYRVVSRQIETTSGPGTLHIAASLDDVHETIELLTRTLAVIVPLVVIVLTALVWWLAGRALRPVEVMRTDVERMSGSDLSARVTEPTTRDEIGRLSTTMNSLLDRIESANVRQQQFVGDASHELRSPLARMRTELEVDLAHPGSADPVATHRSVLAEVIGMQHLVDDLLRLAQADAHTTGEHETVDLQAVVLAEAERLRRSGDRQIDTSSATEAMTTGDRSDLARAIRNLADNATRHAATTVWLASSTEDGRVVVEVADDGPGIPGEQREAVFDRFTRLDESRSAASGGAGLGLAIAREIVEAHGGAIHVDERDGGGARFVVSLPSRR